MYLLDTNIISYWMRGDKVVTDKIKNHSPSELSLSAITLAEILYGIEKSPVKKKERLTKIRKIISVIRLYPFDDACAEKYAVIRARLEQAGTVISERDTQIASIGLANQLVVVTHNIKEFSRVESLRVEDWAR